MTSKSRILRKFSKFKIKLRLMKKIVMMMKMARKIWKIPMRKIWLEFRAKLMRIKIVRVIRKWVKIR